ncbi:transcriptional regulator [Scytonema hofmannii PCC 7110]|uniref:Transcriptional regulator n=1 Tax=Scytonema hofmannii PCC 7110 TaxID=128403 RepID=A0A139XGU3_9CYAN|nr:hypothetical protein [Scytonema hofmannii]KYC43910.1 transcriptional regulator [Scytonema hofmannii PCC 7110]
MPKTKSYHSFLIESLKDPNEAAAYLNAALEEQDPQLFLLAVRNVAEAHGEIAKLLETTQLNQDNLHQMLAKAENPTLYNFASILDILGFKLAITVKESNQTTKSVC